MTDRKTSVNPEQVQTAALDLYAALNACAFRLGVLVAAHGEFTEVNAKALDAAQAALAKAEGR